MKVIADLHIHSKYSRGCSRELTLTNIAKWCGYKGIGLVATGDFTHPAWFKSIKEELVPAESGFFRLKDDSSAVRFVLGGEISCIYTQGGKCRRIHVCLLLPSIESAEKLIQELTDRGCNLKSDGRPIIGLSAKELARLAFGIDENIIVFPAHVWTPWFAVFGSKSGFDSLEECFEELTSKIFALETGLSSDPAMNRRLSKLDRLTLLSNSDAHSPANLGREANVFDFAQGNFDYQELKRIIESRDKEKFLMTLEFFPEEGKYHIDGHAACNFSCEPEKSKQLDNKCPKCGKPLILGVLHRVNLLADRLEVPTSGFVPYKNLIPLQEIIADVLAVGKNSKKVQREYFNLIQQHDEFAVLLDLSLAELQRITLPEIAEAVSAMRRGQVEIAAGYDGIFGKVKIKNARPRAEQKRLF
ncbi:MAG: endonuclease Q family protein [Candidatus Buchananbacteria bacterium]